MKLKFFLVATLVLASCGKNKTTTEQKDTTTTNSENTTVYKDETLCFELKETIDISEDEKGNGDKMSMTTSVQIITKGNEVTGTIAEERLVNGANADAASGDLKGIRKGDTLIVDYTFTIEGYTETQEIVYLLQGDKLSEKSGELTEKNGKMVYKDPSKATFDKVYTKVNCQ